MIFKQSGRDGADVVFINVRNVSGAAVSAGAAVEWDAQVATDGNAVTACKSGSIAGLFCGIADSALADSAYGLAQVYGYRQSAWVSGASAGNYAGQFLTPTLGILTDATMSAATTSGFNFVSLADTLGAAAGNSATQQLAVFIRAM